MTFRFYFVSWFFFADCFVHICANKMASVASKKGKKKVLKDISFLPSFPALEKRHHWKVKDIEVIFS